MKNEGDTRFNRLRPASTHYIKLHPPQVIARLYHFVRVYSLKPTEVDTISVGFFPPETRETPYWGAFLEFIFSQVNRTTLSQF